jgi:hypothetical protein
MPSEINIEQKIREAMERGDFDNLKGAGKPLELDGYFAMPEDMRMAFAMLRSNEFVPEEVEMLKEIAELKDKIRLSVDAAERELLTVKLNERNLAFAIVLEKYNRKK